MKKGLLFAVFSIVLAACDQWKSVSYDFSLCCDIMQVSIQSHCL